MARTSYFTGFPLDQTQSVYVEDILRQLGDLYTDTEEILNTTIVARDQAVASAQSATSSENISVAARDEALVAKQEAQEAALDAEQARLQAQQAAADAEGSSQIAATSAATATDVMDQVTNLYGDVTEIHDAVSTAVDAKDEAVQAKDAILYALENAEEIYGDTAALQLAVTQAEDARDASQDAQTLAEKWASEAEDVPVVPGQFSARHWASKASAEVASTAKKNANLSDLTNLKEARSNLGTFSSVADVQNSHISPVLDSVQTNGYYAAGDGGGALYKRVVSEPSHAGKIQSADGAWWELAEAVVNVLQFGARRDATPGPDTGTDDSAAFNALTEYLRESMYSSGPNGYREGIGMVRIVIPPGYYLMESSWDLTDFRSARNITIEGHGAVLIGKTPGYAVVDALDSRWVHFHGLTVHGSLHAPPRCGIQIGKTGQVTAVGNNALDEVRCMGSFELAAFANFGCETTTHRRCRYINIMEDSGSTERFAYIGVGDFIVMPTSSVKSVTAVPGPVSFTQNSFYSCDFRNLANGSTLLITSSKAHYFDKGCYYVAFRRANVVLDHSLSNNEFLTLKGHFESNQTGQVPGAEGVQWLILWRGNGSDVSLPSFELETSTVHALSAVIRAENIGSGSRMSPAILRVPNFRPTSPSCLFFRGDGSTFTFVGEIFTDAEDRLNLGYLSRMSGSVYCRNRTRILSWADGTYTVYDQSPRSALTVGYESSGVPSASKNSVVASTLTFTPSVTFAEPGDLSVSYDVRNGYYTILPGNLLYVEVVLRFTPTYSTAAGGIRITGLPHSAALGSLRNGVINVSQMNNVAAAASSHIVGAIVPGSEEILLRDIAGGSTTLLSPSHFPSGTEFTLVLSGLYKAADVV